MTTAGISSLPFATGSERSHEARKNKGGWARVGRRAAQLLVTRAFAVTAGNAHAAESETTSVAGLIREWDVLEAACRGSNEPEACDKLNRIGAELGQKGFCFNGYGSGRRWVKVLSPWVTGFIASGEHDES